MTKKPQLTSLPAWIFALAFFPLGLGGIAVGGSGILHGYKSRHWPVAPGVVLSSQLLPRFLVPDQPSIRYSYSFDGHSYVSNRFWPGDIITAMPLVRASTSARLLEKFPAGQPIAVYVNPRDPTDVALIPGPSRALQWTVVFVIFLLAGFCF
jgi:hypothetical protein